MLSPRLTFLLASLTLATRAIDAASVAQEESMAPLDGTVIKTALDTANSGENLLKLDRFAPYERGFEREDKIFVCDNGGDSTARRGVIQSVELNQKRPEPIVATAWSKAESVTGTPDPDYSLYLDLVYADGAQLWGQSASFSTGTHDWQKRQVLVLPEKPVKRLSFYLLLRGHGGKVSFRDPELRMVQAPAGAHVFDGVPVVLRGRSAAGFQVRDVAAGSDFVRIEKQTLGLSLNVKTSESSGATFFDVTLADSTGKDRAITL